MIGHNLSSNSDFSPPFRELNAARVRLREQKHGGLARRAHARVGSTRGVVGTHVKISSNLRGRGLVGHHDRVPDWASGDWPSPALILGAFIPPLLLLGARQQLDASFACLPNTPPSSTLLPKQTGESEKIPQARARARAAMDAGAEELGGTAQPQEQVSFAEP